MRTRLNIPDHEIPSAKSLGAQFDKTKNEWFVENQDDLVPYLRWMDKRITGPYNGMTHTVGGVVELLVNLGFRDELKKQVAKLN